MPKYIDTEVLAEQLRLTCGLSVPASDNSGMARGYRLAYTHILAMLETGQLATVELPEALPDAPEGSVVSVRTVPVYDTEEIHHGCTVQVWSNSQTGEQSIGWWYEDQDEDRSGE